MTLNVKSYKWKYILVILFIAQSAASEDGFVSKYARIRQLYPQVAQNTDVKQWRAANDGQQHPCKRKCVANQTMTCYYYLVVHYDETMGPGCEPYLNAKYRFKIGSDEFIDGSAIRADLAGHNDCKYADGVRSEVMLVNGALPGPTIELCYGDTIVADVINSLHETTTIHWHGMHQRKTPHMDGVPHITQYPIEAGQAFRYRFEVDHAGTNWWHSHTDAQRAYGLAGALIVRQPQSANVHAHLYDFDYTEHTIMLQDWVYDFDETVPQNILVNGLGRNVQRSANSAKRPTLYESFKVVRGGRYRFRAIFNGISNCPISLSIDEHDLVVIASDGNDIEPVTVQKIIFHGAERFDFVLHANREIDNYWLRVKGYQFCEVNKLHQEAILHYVGADKFTKPRDDLRYDYEREGIELNPLSVAPNDNDAQRITIVETNAFELRLERPPKTPFRTIYTSMSVNTRGVFMFQMDDISFTMPKMSLLQTRNLGIGAYFCNRTQQAAQGFNCRSRHCRCTNVIQVPAFKHVEFVIASLSASPHPIHLHGYTFRVVGLGVLGENRINMIEQIDRQTPLPRRIRGAPLKDSVQVPAFGYTIIRFYTDNPGYWMFHCHIATHAENGMAAVMRVGDDVQMKMCPVSNCGLCSSVL